MSSTEISQDNKTKVQTAEKLIYLRYPAPDPEADPFIVFKQAKCNWCHFTFKLSPHFNVFAARHFFYFKNILNLLYISA